MFKNYEFTKKCSCGMWSMKDDIFCFRCREEVNKELEKNGE
jgi:hypothetical protein